MAPGTWNAPGERYTIASASGEAYCTRCGRLRITTLSANPAAPDLPAVYTCERGR